MNLPVTEKLNNTNPSLRRHVSSSGETVDSLCPFRSNIYSRSLGRHLERTEILMGVDGRKETFR